MCVSGILERSGLRHDRPDFRAERHGYLSGCSSKLHTAALTRNSLLIINRVCRLYTDLSSARHAYRSINGSVECFLDELWEKDKKKNKVWTQPQWTAHEEKVHVKTWVMFLSIWFSCDDAAPNRWLLRSHNVATVKINVSKQKKDCTVHNFMHFSFLSEPGVCITHNATRQSAVQSEVLVCFACFARLHQDSQKALWSGTPQYL